MTIKELEREIKKYQELEDSMRSIQSLLMLKRLSLIHQENEEKNNPNLNECRFLRLTIGDNDFMHDATVFMGNLIRDIFISNEVDVNDIDLEELSEIIEKIWINTIQLDRFLDKNTGSVYYGNHYFRPSLSIVTYDEMDNEDWENGEVMYIPINFEGEVVIK